MTNEISIALCAEREIEDAHVGLRELDKKLKRPGCRLKYEKSVQDAAAIEQARASRSVSATVTTTTIVAHKQQQRGCPGPNTAYVRIEEHRYCVTGVTVDDTVRDDAYFDRCWPVMTNDTVMTNAELLTAIQTARRRESPPRAAGSRRLRTRLLEIQRVHRRVRVPRLHRCPRARPP